MTNSISQESGENLSGSKCLWKKELLSLSYDNATYLVASLI
jgi:hypothetical protein